MSSRSEIFVRGLLDRADIKVGGDRPFDIHIHDARLYGRIVSHGTLGFGEAYMQGLWDSDAIDQLIYRALVADLRDAVRLDVSLVLSWLRGIATNFQRTRAFEVGQKHYDIGNELYAAMLDKRMIYSCGYWKNAVDLDAAQDAKLDLTCRKLGLQPGMRVLDIGCGWGGFLKFAAENYGVNGVGITISRQQAEFARQNLSGLPIEIELKDYRSLSGRFDRIVSVGMFEHVGYKNYRGFFQTAERLLTDDGLLLLHTIGGNLSQTHGDPWSEKYIFPNGMLPSIRQIGAAIERLFVVEDWHNFGADYDPTLMAWHKNFETAWPKLAPRYDEGFLRMWRYYLLSFAAIFRAHHAQLWQIVLSKKGVPGGYESIR